MASRRNRAFYVRSRAAPMRCLRSGSLCSVNFQSYRGSWLLSRRIWFCTKWTSVDFRIAACRCCYSVWFGRGVDHSPSSEVLYSGEYALFPDLRTTLHKNWSLWCPWSGSLSCTSLDLSILRICHNLVTGSSSGRSDVNWGLLASTVASALRFAEEAYTLHSLIAWRHIHFGIED